MAKNAVSINQYFKNIQSNKKLVIAFHVMSAMLLIRDAKLFIRYSMTVTKRENDLSISEILIFVISAC